VKSRAVVCALCLIGLASPARAASVGPFWAVLDAEVPTGKKKPVCQPQEIGQLAAIAGVDQTTIVTVMGWKRSQTAGDLCSKELRFVHLVVGDPAPPRMKDGNSLKEIKKGEWYVEPLRGGSVPAGKESGELADDKPFYDGETRDTKAGDTGEFGESGNNLSKTRGWDKDTKLDLVFGARPDSLKPGLEFITVLVGATGSEICPIAAVAWGMKADGAAHLEWPVQGAKLAALLPSDKLSAALTRSGFSGYTVREACCNCGAPVKRAAKGKKR
jgi:hypothetical protein